MKYNELVEKISVAIHESQMRSRNTIMNRYKESAEEMHKRWDKDMTEYAKLPENVKEYDRMEAREILALIDKLPNYITKNERDIFNSCISKNNKLDINEEKIKCFREMKLQCKPEHRLPNKENIYC